MRYRLQLFNKRGNVASEAQTQPFGGFSMADVTKTLKDAFYVTVGLGVITVREAKERRQALRAKVGTQLTDTGEQFQKLAKRVETRLEPVRELVGNVELKVPEIRVPDSARELVGKARQAAKDAQGQLQTLSTQGLAVLNRNGSKAAAA
jgi:hypothetical protein